MTHPPDPSASTWRPVRRWAGYLIGAGLLIACIVAAVRGTGGRPADWSALRAAPAWLLIGLGVMIVANWLLSGLTYSFATWPVEAPDRPVPMRTMVALIAASTLLNYLPLRAGLFGRAFYLKRYYDISLRSCLVVVVCVMAGSAVLYGAVFASALIDARVALGVIGGLGLVSLLALGALSTRAGRHKPAAGRAFDWRGRLPARSRMRLAVAGAATGRVADLAATVFRLTAVLMILSGPPVMAHRGFDLLREAIILATGGMFITMAGLTPNGLGLREWLYGLIAASGLIRGDAAGGLELGLQVALIDRAAEVLVVIPTGLAAMGYLRCAAKRDGQAATG